MRCMIAPYKCREIGAHFILSSATGGCCVVVAKQCMVCPPASGTGNPVLRKQSRVLRMAVCLRSFNSSTLTCSDAFRQLSAGYTPLSGSAPHGPHLQFSYDQPSPPYLPCSNRGARHNYAVAGRAPITHVWSRCSYTWCCTRMLLEHNCG
jgi:hypothetical protein